MFDRFNFEKISEIQNLDRILDFGKEFDRSKPEDFLDIYTLEEVEKDKEHASLIEARIKEKENKMNPQEKEINEINKKRGEAMEIVLDFLVNEYGWISYGYNTRTSRVDDLISGVDSVIEYERDEIERIALAIDASTSSDVKKIEEKIIRNLNNLKSNSKGVTIKYFKSQIKDKNDKYFKGELRNIIPVVAGADKNNANDLFDKFSQLIIIKKKNNKDLRKESDNLKSEISKHPAHRIILEGIKIQLEMYLNVLDDNKKDQINRLIEIVNEAIAGVGLLDESVQDNTLDNIRIISKNFV